MRNLILTIGIPGAGKTTWAQHYIKRYPATAYISSDQVRFDLTGTYDCNPEDKETIHEEVRRRAQKSLDENKDVLIDATNTDTEEWVKFKKLQPTLFVAKVFDVDPEEAFLRIQERSRKVPMNVLEEKWKELENGRKFLRVFFNFIL